MTETHVMAVKAVTVPTYHPNNKRALIHAVRNILFIALLCYSIRFAFLPAIIQIQYAYSRFIWNNGKLYEVLCFSI